MTLAEFQAIPDGAVFDMGILPNSPDGLFMTNGGGKLTWIAKKGHGNDWCIYCHWVDTPIQFIKTGGDKVKDKNNILKCMPDCEPILHLYRY